jgi:hypothetical protein|nr:hypothetical protein Q903MT_gene1180 [Picea sitchensis]
MEGHDWTEVEEGWTKDFPCSEQNGKVYLAAMEYHWVMNDQD